MNPSARIAALERQRRALAALLLLLSLYCSFLALHAPAAALPAAPTLALAALARQPLPSAAPPSDGSSAAPGACCSGLAACEAAAAAAAPPQPFFTAPLSLFIGILSRNSEEGAQERAAARATTLLLLHQALAANPAWQAAHKFIVTAPPPGTQELEALQREAASSGDLVLLPDLVDPPRADRRTLTQRVHHMFHWGARENATWVLKTDTDAFVNYGLLLQELAAAPRARFTWGRLGGPPDSPDFPSDGLPPAAAPYFAAGAPTPYYMSGWGYILTTDLVADAAHRPFEHLMDCEYYEDICTGLRLVPYAPLQRNDARFCQDASQWGWPSTLCRAEQGAKDTLLRHHVGVQRMHELLGEMQGGG